MNHIGLDNRKIILMYSAGDSEMLTWIYCCGGSEGSADEHVYTDSSDCMGRDGPY